MSRIIKTISLDKESDEIASKMGNFSKWVRSQLKAHAHTISFEHTNKELFMKQGICNPNNSPRCAICYPYGKPYSADIKFFNQGLITKERLQELANFFNILNALAFIWSNLAIPEPSNESATSYQ